MTSLSILFTDQEEIVLQIPEDGKPKGPWFSLKEGSRYRLKFTFQVNNNIVSGLKYTNTVWKGGFKGNLNYNFSLRTLALDLESCVEVNFQS